MFHFHNPLPAPLPFVPAAPAGGIVIDLVSDDGSDDGGSSVVILDDAAAQNGGVVVVVGPPAAAPVAQPPPFRYEMAINLSGVRPQAKNGVAYMAGGRIFSPSKNKMNAFALRCVEMQSPPADKSTIREVSINMTFYFKIPKNLNKAVVIGQPHAKKPDIDNLEKFVLDALKGIYFGDDALVVATKKEKLWHFENGYAITLSMT